MYYFKLAQELLEIRRRMAKASNFSRFTNPDNGENFVLAFLSNAKEQVNPKEIGNTMQVSSARIAKILNQLEAKKMIARLPSTEDGRFTTILLLPEGEVQYKKNVEQFYKNAAHFLESLGPDDATEYVRLQNKIADIYAQTHD